jgi:outer membrane protein OmpA-like peptidoglycan-associated protein
LIARETALLKKSQEEISQGESERQQVMLDVRRADALRSEQRATSALEDAQRERLAATEARAAAETARLSAEALRLQAEELAKKVSELEARPTDRGLVLTLGDVLFDFGQASLKPGGMQTVNQLGDFLNEYPERHILIEGFTDSIGSEEFNQVLSGKRAESVKNALMSKGVASDRIRVRGYGTQHPVADNATEAGRSRNRRVEVVISDQAGMIKDRTGSN